MTLARFALAILVGLLPATSHAQSADRSITCGLMDDMDNFSDILYVFLGEWQVQHLDGYAVFGPMALPFPGDGQIDTITLEQSGNDLIATHPEMQAPMVFSFVDEAPWEFLATDEASGIPDPSITSADIELLTNCPMAEIPRLIGRTQVTLDGITMDFVWRMMIVDGNQMFAVQHTTGTVDGVPMITRRTVSLTR